MALFANSMVDRIARRPNGLLGRLLYRFPIGHKAGFDLVLANLAPDRADRILEVGCGGGVFLRRALATGCRAVAIDHSADMVAATRRLNAGAHAEGRLEVHEADAAALPFEAESVDKIYCLNAFFFFPDPARSIAEMARVLKPGGTVALVTSPPEMREKIAKFSASMAESMRFDRPEDLKRWIDAAGLGEKAVITAANVGYLYLATKEALA